MGVDIQESIMYWVGYAEEANRSIEAFSSMKGGLFNKHLEDAKVKRDQALQKIAELGGDADALRLRFGLRKATANE